MHVLRCRIHAHHSLSFARTFGGLSHSLSVSVGLYGVLVLVQRTPIGHLTCSLSCLSPSLSEVRCPVRSCSLPLAARRSSRWRHQIGSTQWAKLQSSPTFRPTAAVRAAAATLLSAVLPPPVPLPRLNVPIYYQHWLTARYRAYHLLLLPPPILFLSVGALLSQCLCSSASYLFFLFNSSPLFPPPLPIYSSLVLLFFCSLWVSSAAANSHSHSLGDSDSLSFFGRHSVRVCAISNGSSSKSATVVVAAKRKRERILQRISHREEGMERKGKGREGAVQQTCTTIRAPAGKLKRGERERGENSCCC